MGQTTSRGFPAGVAAGGVCGTPARLLIFAALGLEVRALRRALPGAARLAWAPMTGDWGGPSLAGLAWAPPPGVPPQHPPVLVLQTGMSCAALGAGGAAAAIRAARPSAILAVGFGGGLSPAVKVGELVLGDPVVDSTGPGHWRPAVGLASAAAGAARRARLVLHAGPVLSVSKTEATPAGKAVAGGRSAALALDMESACLARAAAEAGVPFVAVRVISDAAGDRLPDEPWRLVTADGRAPFARALRYLARRPQALPTLVRTGLRARRAALALAAFADAWLDSAGR